MFLITFTQHIILKLYHIAAIMAEWDRRRTQMQQRDEWAGTQGKGSQTQGAAQVSLLWGHGGEGVGL